MINTIWYLPRTFFRFVVILVVGAAVLWWAFDAITGSNSGLNTTNPAPTTPAELVDCSNVGAVTHGPDTYGNRVKLTCYSYDGATPEWETDDMIKILNG